MYPKYSSKDLIPPGFMDAYHEVDGEWVHNAPAPDTTAADKLQIALEKERDQRKEAEKAAKSAAASLKAAELKAAAGEAGISDERLAEISAKVRTDVEAEYAEQITALKAQVETIPGLTGEIRGMKLDGQIKTSFGKNGVRADRVEELFTLTQSEYDLTENGTPMLTNHPGKTVDVFTSDDLKKRYPEFFIGTQATGGGAGGSGGAGGDGAAVTAEQIFSNPTGALAAARSGGE